MLVSFAKRNKLTILSVYLLTFAVYGMWGVHDIVTFDAEGLEFMLNGIHPSRAGYREWWTPKFEAFPKNYL